MADWAEVRRLAADFQRLQASSSVYKLSERNCVELVATLVKRGFLEILYTLDGKEYMTPGQLDREVKDELVAHGGRINIVDLQQILNVDLTHIEASVLEMVKHDHTLTLLNGELIDRSYIQHLCEEINDIIQEAGQASVTDLSRNFSLPINFLLEHIEAALGVYIKGHLDKSDAGIIYTESHVNRYRSRVRGVFSAITHPTSIGNIIVEGHFQEKLFKTVLHQLISSEGLAGDIKGRQDKAVYIPHVYIRNQNKWADSFLDTNGYLEYDALSRLGIHEPCEFVSQRYRDPIANGNLVQLSTCCVGKGVINRVEGSLEEVLVSANWIDTMPLLPSPCTARDAQLLLHHIGTSQPELQVFGSVATNNNFLRVCCEHFKPAIIEKAHEVACQRLPEMSVPKSEEKASGNRKKGGGGRKGGKGKGRDQEPDEYVTKTTSPFKFMTIDEIAVELTKKMPICPEEFLQDIAVNIESSLQDSFRKAVQECVLTAGQNTPSNLLKKKHAQLQEKLQGLWNMLHLFEKAIVHFDDETVVLLNRYLLRTLCSDLCDLLVMYLADDNTIIFPSKDKFTIQERTNIIGVLPVSMKKKLMAINTALSGKVVAAFIPLFEEICVEEYCGVMLKKIDKKKERQLLFSHHQSLLENLRHEWEPSMVLHLVVVILFQQYTNCVIHVSGKLLPKVIKFLQKHIPTEQYAQVTTLEQLVIQQHKSSVRGGKACMRKDINKEDEEHIEQEMPLSGEAEGRPEAEYGRVSGTAYSEEKQKKLLDDLKHFFNKPTKTHS